MRQRFAMAAGILAVGFLCAGKSHAVDSKIFPGSLCRYAGKAADDVYFDTENAKATGLENISINTKAVMCPIVRDRVTKDIEYIEVNFSGSVTCVVYQVSTGFIGVSPVDPDPGSTSPLKFSGITSQDISVQDDASLSLRCVLGPGAFIYNYRVDEA